jgi:hypothetical protein
MGSVSGTSHAVAGDAMGRLARQAKRPADICAVLLPSGT